MKIHELIKLLKTYPKDIDVALVNLDDDSGESNEALEKSALCIIESYDEFEEKLTGVKFLGISHKNAVRLREE